MAPVAGKPFLHYIFLYLQKHGITEAILSVGYKSEVIQEFFGEKYAGINIGYTVEHEPLGTGGGIRLRSAVPGGPVVFWTTNSEQVAARLRQQGVTVNPTVIRLRLSSIDND